MIFCRDLNIIFIKTKKVGGTSFEIALSKYCDENDIVAPISPEDEVTRESLGYQRPVNYNNQNRSNELINLGITGNFYNHISAENIRQNLGEDILVKVQKFLSIENLLILSFQCIGFKKLKKAFFTSRMDKKKYHLVENNYKIAPINGPNSADIILDYKTLADDIKSKGTSGQFFRNL